MALNLVPNHIPSLDNGDDLLIIDINVESDANDGVALYGGYFEIDLDQFSPVVKNAEFTLDDESWYCEDALNTIYLQVYDPATNTLEVAFTQLDQSNQIGSGRIGQTILEISDVEGGNGVNEVILKNVQFNNSNGDLLPLYGDTIRFGSSISGMINIDSSDCEINWNIDQNIDYYKVYKASNTIQTSGAVNVVNGDNMSYKAANRITLNSGFSTKPGASFKAYTEPCSTSLKTEESNDYTQTPIIEQASEPQKKHTESQELLKHPIINAQPTQDLKD